MFGAQFYPTPSRLARTLIAGVDWKRGIQSVLEPSAGRGDLIAAADSHMTHLGYRLKTHTFDADVIELDPELASILRGKNYRLIWDDFLTFRSWKRYDLIVMNPPFADGLAHLNKALDMQAPYGGQVACILNAETLRNPYTRERRELIARLNSTSTTSKIEYVKAAFTDADRSTNVEVALIWATTQAPDRTDRIRADFHAASQQASTEAPQARHDTVDVGDVIDNMIADFDVEAAAGVRLIDTWAETSSLLNHGSAYRSPSFELRIGSSEATVNSFLQALRRRYWADLFENPALIASLTIGLRDELRTRIDEFAGYDFNTHNIRALQLSLLSSLNRSAEDEAVKVFDTCSQQHAYSKFSSNVHYYNGWKTNEAWKIGKRVVVPVHLGWFGQHGSTTQETLADIELVLNYFDGMRPIDRPVAERIETPRDIPTGTKIEFAYFTVIAYAKGTVHITFTRPDLVKRLNVFAGKRYNMLPPDYGTTPYSGLDEAQRALVDAFEGKTSYASTHAEVTATGGRLLALDAA